MLFLLLPFLLSGCLDNSPTVETTTTSTTTTTTLPTMVAALPKAAWPNEEWTKLAKSAVTQHIDVSQEIKDAESYCFNFKMLSKDQKENFFVSLISIMSKYESDFDPATVYRECNKNKCVYGSCIKTKYGYCMEGSKLDEGIAISRGLLQMSIESAKAYGCPITSPKELHDPKINIDCAARILGRWIGKDKRISGIGPGEWKGGARYWAVLRSTNGSHQKIQSWTRDSCK